MNQARRLFNKSVLRPTGPNASMSDVFAALFHRLAATVYFLYAIWALVAFWTRGVPAVTSQAGSQWAQIFVAIVFLTAAPACLGATFFPALARVELYAGGAYSMLILVYVAFTLKAAFFDGGSWTAPFIIASVAVMPVCRVVIIVYFLLERAKERLPDPESE